MTGPNSSENPLSPEILKLIEKLEKDPKSKLFVPLAEEYLKSGMLEEASMILVEGLKIHPKFPSAKTTLGKVHLEKGEIQEARAQFEEVLSANSDNLFAHRKLARIYRAANEFGKARASCQMVLSLNPKDPDMKALMDELEQLTKDLGESSSAGQSEAFEPQVMGSETSEPVSGHQTEEKEELSSAEEGEVRTEALADLYIEQGYYDKGKNIYKQILADDPENEGLKRKIEQTDTLINLFSNEEAEVQGAQAPFSKENVVESSPPGAVTKQVLMDGSLDSLQDKKIKRLESWLESLRKGMEK